MEAIAERSGNMPARLICTAAVLLAGTAGVKAAGLVTVENFVQAESDSNIRANLAKFQALGADVGQIIHRRNPVSPDNQTVIRSNQDTLYSAVVLDLSKPVTVTFPDTGDRHLSIPACLPAMNATQGPRSTGAPSAPMA